MIKLEDFATNTLNNTQSNTLKLQLKIVVKEAK